MTRLYRVKKVIRKSWIQKMAMTVERAGRERENRAERALSQSQDRQLHRHQHCVEGSAKQAKKPEKPLRKTWSTY